MITVCTLPTHSPGSTPSPHWHGFITIETANGLELVPWQTARACRRRLASSSRLRSPERINGLWKQEATQVFLFFFSVFLARSQGTTRATMCARGHFNMRLTLICLHTPHYWSARDPQMESGRTIVPPSLTYGLLSAAGAGFQKPLFVFLHHCTSLLRSASANISVSVLATYLPTLHIPFFFFVNFCLAFFLPVTSAWKLIHKWCCWHFCPCLSFELSQTTFSSQSVYIRALEDALQAWAWMLEDSELVSGFARVCVRRAHRGVFTLEQACL